MILDQVLQRKMRVISMDDTLQVAAVKLRALDEIDSPILASPEERDRDDMVQILESVESPRFFLVGWQQLAHAVPVPSATE